jgi:hypothetical protein
MSYNWIELDKRMRRGLARDHDITPCLPILRLVRVTHLPDRMHILIIFFFVFLQKPRGQGLPFLLLDLLAGVIILALYN